MITNRPLVLLTAGVFAVSTMFPLVAAVVEPDPTPWRAGLANVALAFIAWLLAWVLPAALSLWRCEPRP